MQETRDSANGAGSRRRVRPWEKGALVGLGLAVVSVVAFTVFAQGDEAPESAPVPGERVVAVQDLLDTWAQAVRTDDAETLTTLFDSAASSSFVAAESARATNLSRVNFSDWGYELVAGADHEVDSGLAEGLGASEVWAPTVRLRYAIDGVDAVSTRKTVAPIFVRRGESWALLDDRAAGADAPWRGPWDFAPVVTRTVPTGDGRTSMVIGHAGNENMIERLAEELPSAVDNVEELWGAEWSRNALVMVASSAEEFTALVGSGHDGADIAAVAVSDAPTPGDPVVAGQRIVFSPAASVRLTDESRREILRHELTHVATRARTVDGSPMWLLEGYAEYSAYRSTDSNAREIAPGLAARFDDGEAPESLPANTDFTEPGAHGSIAYETSWSINAFVADEFGEEKLTDLYSTSATGSSDDDAVEDGLSEVLGIDTDEFVQRWREWLDEQFT